MVSSPIQTDTGFKAGGLNDNAIENDIQRQWCFNPNGHRSSQSHFSPGNVATVTGFAREEPEGKFVLL